MSLEALLTKKLVTMLSAIGEASERDVTKWRDRIEADGGRETGERVLAVVDRLTSTHKANLIGKVFREYLDGRCDRALSGRLAVGRLPRSLDQAARFGRR